MVSSDAPMRTPKFYGREAEPKEMLTHLRGPSGEEDYCDLEAWEVWQVPTFSKIPVSASRLEKKKKKKNSHLKI